MHGGDAKHGFKHGVVDFTAGSLGNFCDKIS